MSVNKVILLGRLGQDPEIKYTASGAGVCNFSLATSESWNDRNSGQRQEKTEWHRVVVWGKLAEFCNQYLAKGREVFLEGRLQTRAWDDKDGNKRYTTEIVASTVQFVGPKPAAGQGGQYAGPSSNSSSSDNSFDQSTPASADASYSISSDVSFASDDIPF